jgi:hypothetical protein
LTQSLYSPDSTMITGAPVDTRRAAPRGPATPSCVMGFVASTSIATRSLLTCARICRSLRARRSSEPCCREKQLPRLGATCSSSCASRWQAPCLST